jgi:hypothetical protein
LVNEKKIDLDKHLSTILFSYRIASKVATSYTPYQLVYGLHPLMPIEYVLSAISGDQRNIEPTRVLTTIIIELEKLQETNWKLIIMCEPTSATNFYGVNKKILKRNSNLEIMSYGFPKEKNTFGQIQEKMVWSIQSIILLTNNIVIVSVNNFEPNLVLVNVNKFKPYTYVNQTLKGIQNSKDQNSL